MTVKELIERLQELPENAEVQIQYRDSGGIYEGTDDTIYLEIEDRDDQEIVIL